MTSTDIMGRDSEGKTVRFGTVTATGSGPAQFEGVPEWLAGWLRQGITIWEGDEEVKLTPADGERYIGALPIYLHGDRLWATVG